MTAPAFTVPFANLANMWNLLINPRIGAAYLWGGCFDAVDHTVGADCSGCAGMVTASLQQGLNVQFEHYFSTMDFAGLQPGAVGPMGIVIVGSLADIPANAAVQYSILQGDSAEDSHIICAVPATVDAVGNYGPYVTIESGGNENCLATGSGATSMTDPEFNQWAYLPGPIQPAPAPAPLTPEQQNALIIVNTGISLGITPIGQQMALACALAESSMLMYANSSVPESLNYPHDAVGSNYDSCGPFQQRASQGWGTVACEMDWACSATLFYNALARQSYNSGGDPGSYIQAVQNSAIPDAYDAQWGSAVALYNSVANLVPGDDMSAQAEQQIAELYAALLTPVESQSPFRALGEGPVWTPAQMITNDDGFAHPQWLFFSAGHGNTIDLACIEAIAAADVTQYPDREDDIKLAQERAWPRDFDSPDTYTCTDSGTADPVTPTPVPAPSPSPPPAGTITTAQLASWGKDLATVLGVIGTWATSIHGILGQYLNGSATSHRAAGLGAVTTGLVAHRESTCQGGG